MDVDQFAQTVRPNRTGSKLKPFHSQLAQLSAAGYTLVQLQEFLKSNDVRISISTIWEYLQRHAKPSAQLAAAPTQAVSPPLAPPQGQRPPAPSPTPERLSAILRSPPSDLDSLIKHGRRMKPK